MQGMSTLVEIEQAAVKLPAVEQQQLLRFLLRVVPVNESGSARASHFLRSRNPGLARGR